MEAEEGDWRVGAPEATLVAGVSLAQLDKKLAASPLSLVLTARSGGASAGINGGVRRAPPHRRDPRMTHI